MSNVWNRKVATVSCVALVTLAPLLISSPAMAGGTKASSTPYFWQRDPAANFDNEGRNHCAPISISDGLIYLANARGQSDLVDGTSHDDQIALITHLAELMDTDPTQGTNPDQIITGLRRYADEQGYSFERLELSSWRGVSRGNRQYKIGTIPDIHWLTAAAQDPDTVEIFNFGWYQKSADGTYKRLGGHWVDVVGKGAGALQFAVHNPLLAPQQQKAGTSITLSPVARNFTVVQSNGQKFVMSGYYQVQGPGLPFNPKSVSAAVLDSVLVFKFKNN